MTDTLNRGCAKIQGYLHRQNGIPGALCRSNTPLQSVLVIGTPLVSEKTVSGSIVAQKFIKNQLLLCNCTLPVSVRVTKIDCISLPHPASQIDDFISLDEDDLTVKPGSPAARSLDSKTDSSSGSGVEHLLEEAARHLDEAELAKYDLEKEADVARLRALVERLQAETAEFTFGYQIQVRKKNRQERCDECCNATRAPLSRPPSEDI